MNWQQDAWKALSCFLVMQKNQQHINQVIIIMLQPISSFSALTKVYKTVVNFILNKFKGIKLFWQQIVELSKVCSSSVLVAHGNPLNSDYCIKSVKPERYMAKI